MRLGRVADAICGIEFKDKGSELARLRRVASSLEFSRGHLRARLRKKAGDGLKAVKKNIPQRLKPRPFRELARHD